MKKHFDTIGPVSRARLSASFSAAALRAQARAERARAMGNQAGWFMHLNQASHFAHKADLLGG